MRAGTNEPIGAFSTRRREPKMPIFTYFAVVGAALLGVLFYADANLAPRGPLAVTTDFVGLPQPWHGPVNPSLAAAPAPAPDMNSDAVLAASPKTAANAKDATVATIGMAAASEQVARTERAPKKKRQIARRAPQWHEPSPRYAWRYGDPGPFGGGGGGWFGRF
jgi:hypothetical protein